MAKITLFAQIIQKIPRDIVKQIVKEYDTKLYKSRWMIEIFFCNLNQNLHIKSFVGTSRNAVEILIWTALITMLLMSYLRQTAKYDWHFSNLESSLRLNTFTKIDLQKWLDEPFSPPPDEYETDVGVSALFVPVVQPSN